MTLALTVGCWLAACSSGGSDDRTLDAEVEGAASGPARTTVDRCEFDGTNRLAAAGVVRNAGDIEHHVAISVRFVDGDGVRVDIASDSVSALRPGESARWDASVYVEGAADAVRCEVTAEAS
ncbi:MAG: FxLYD domain-containing protein [Acidimicrobiales bacterium]